MGREGSYRLQPNGTLISPHPSQWETTFTRRISQDQSQVSTSQYILQADYSNLNWDSCSSAVPSLIICSVHPPPQQDGLVLSGVPGPGRSLGSRGGRAYRLPELHALQPSSVSLRGRCPASPSLSICDPASTFPAAVAPSPHLRKMHPSLQISLHRGRVGGRQSMAPFSSVRASCFGNEKPPLPFPPLWGAPFPPSPHSPEVLTLRSSYVQLCGEISAFLPRGANAGKGAHSKL